MEIRAWLPKCKMKVFTRCNLSFENLYVIDFFHVEANVLFVIRWYLLCQCNV